jgi:hypothetical protein
MTTAACGYAVSCDSSCTVTTGGIVRPALVVSGDRRRVPEQDRNRGVGHMLVADALGLAPARSNP